LDNVKVPITQSSKEDKMDIIYKSISESNRSMYLYYPPGPNRTAFKRCSITVLRDGDDEASVHKLLFETGLTRLAENDDVILSFPNPLNGRWNSDLSGEDVAAFNKFQDAMIRPDDRPFEFSPNGFPTYESMMSTWHPMNDTKYLIGIGSGADLACTLAANYPENIAAVLCINPTIAELPTNKATFAPMPVHLVNCPDKIRDYFIKANEAEPVEQGNNISIYENKLNPLQRVIDDRLNKELTPELLESVWNELFKKVRRTNTGAHGDCEPRMDIKKASFEIYLDDDRLDGKPHTWFTHVPSGIKKDQTEKVPLLVFFHGGSDNPAEAAEMSKFHELGEKEGFITVYPWGGNKTQWNCNMDESEPDDVGFAVALIKHMIANYPVDEGRVYLSGFSNGAAHAQAVAMVHPELIAGICHINSNWPGRRIGPSDINVEEMKPFSIALEKKKKFDYRMPVWYTYGSREASYPVYRGCTQQHQYDFWKRYNNIEIAPTPERDNPHPCGCGVPGHKYTLLKPSKRHPHHEYDVHSFYSMDKEPLNLYNYVLMRDKGHEVAEMDPALGWAYVKKFRRLPDGGLEIIK